MARGRRIAGAIRSLINARGLKLECARGLHELVLMLVLMYGSETMMWREKERSWIRAVQMVNLRGLLGIRIMDSDERIGGVLRCFGDMERMENDRIAKRVYVGECAGSCSVVRPPKSWIDTVKDCLKKRGLTLTRCQASKENGPG